MSEQEKIKEKLLKLLELSRRGVGGERQSAESMLNRMLAKHGMSMEDLESWDLQTIDTVFSFNTDMEKRLLYQIAFHVVNGDFDAFIIGKKRRKLRMTRSQTAKVQVMYSVLARAMREELKIFFSAFVMKNRLYPDSAIRPEAEFSQDEIERMERVSRMASGINRAIVNKQIGGAK